MTTKTVVVAIVDIELANNVYWDDAFQYGKIGDTSWSFTGKSFLLDMKVNKSDATAVLSLSSGAAQIVVDDAVQRILHFFVSDHVIRAALTPCQRYFYDLIMVDSVTGQRDALMRGEICVAQGVTIED